jgi:hypothetical protein
MGVRSGEETKKKYWLWKWTFGADQREHLEEKKKVRNEIMREKCI